MAEGPDPNAWMVTFADLVMLLLTFFVLLLTMSSMDEKKLKTAFNHFKGATGVLNLADHMKLDTFSDFIKIHKDIESTVVVDSDLLKDLLLPSKGEESQATEKLKYLADSIDITDDERGIVITFHEDILFDAGEAVLKKHIYPILDSIVYAIESNPNDILIMGHTDNIPIKTKQYRSNYELSLFRSIAVLKYFLKDKHLSSNRFSVGGYGPSRPLHPNDSPKNRALNRRVEIIFKHLD